MLSTGQTVLFAALIWYFSTGVIFYLDGLASRTFRWSMLGATIVSTLALCGMSAERADMTVSGAYCGFTCGVLFWAWQEMAFLMGFVTGPRRAAPPAGCKGWTHFGYAVLAVLWHELAILAGAIVAVAVSWGGANQFGAWTFLLLWGMRQSAKFNVFLGVRNVNDALLPPHLAFLKPFLTCKPMNLLFPVSITAATIVSVVLVQDAAAATGAERAGLTLLATMAILGLVEHWFLVLPVDFARLWQWSLTTRPDAAKPDTTWPPNRTAILTTAEPVRGPVHPQAAR